MIRHKVVLAVALSLAAPLALVATDADACGGSRTSPTQEAKQAVIVALERAKVRDVRMVDVELESSTKGLAFVTFDRRVREEPLRLRLVRQRGEWRVFIA